MSQNYNCTVETLVRAVPSGEHTSSATSGKDVLVRERCLPNNLLPFRAISTVSTRVKSFLCLSVLQRKFYLMRRPELFKSSKKHKGIVQNCVEWEDTSQKCLLHRILQLVCGKIYIMDICIFPRNLICFY